MPAIYLDGGGALFKSPVVVDERARNSAIVGNARFIGEALAALNLEAINVGRMDLPGGLEFLQELIKDTGIKYVSANIRLSDGSAPFDAYKVFDWGGARVAAFGLTFARPREDLKLGIQVLDPYETAREVVASLSDVDFVICLTDIGYDGDHKLAKEVEGIGLIIGGGMGSRLMRSPLKINDTLILRCADRGRHIGVLDIKETKLSEWKEPEDEQRRARGAATLDLFKEQLPQKALRDTVDKLKTRLEENEGGASVYSHEIIFLTTAVKADPQVQEKMEKLKAINRGRVSRAPPPPRKLQPQRGPVRQQPNRPPPPKSGNTGTMRCRSCHVEQFFSWQGTSHSRSISSLSGGERRDEECLQCHANYLQINTKRVKEPLVGCEACHGEGGGHPGAGSKIVRRVEQAKCKKCHRGYHEGEETFDYMKKLELIRCNRL